jgi:hypothetical protein
MCTLAAMHRAALLLVALAALGCRTGPTRDPLASEIQRGADLTRTGQASDEISVEVHKAAQPILAQAERALRDGRRLLALHNLVAARAELDAARYLRQLAARGTIDGPRFEAEWARLGAELKPDLARPSPRAFDGVQPVAIRALAEAALPQVRLYYEASLDYGRNTMPEAGLFYLGAARAQRDLAAWCRQLSESSAGRAPPLRSLGPELDALEAELLAAYRPPASIDHHGEFIAASAALKEARELDAAGLRRGALLRYLEASLRAAPLRGRTESRAVTDELRRIEARIDSGDTDHSIGRLFVEMAQADLAGARAERAAAVVRDVLPRYFAALEQPARPARRAAQSRVTVTLVRWPFT